MKDSNNMKIVKGIFEDFGRGNIPGVLNVLAEDVIWKQPPEGPPPFAGTLHGRTQVGKWFDQMNEVSETEHFEPVDFIAQDDKVVVLGNYKFRSMATGQPWESDWTMVFTFNDGNVAEYQIYEDTLVQADALGGRNKTLLLQAIEQWNKGNLDTYLELYDSDAKVHHVPTQFPPGINGIRQFYEGIWTTFSKCKITVHDIFEERDKVACRYTVNASHRETGEDIVMRSLTTLHFSDGKCIERWDADEN